VTRAEFEILAIAHVEDKPCELFGRYSAPIMKEVSIQLALELPSRNRGLYL
jgi:hypothetical protein